LRRNCRPAIGCQQVLLAALRARLALGRKRKEIPLPIDLLLRQQITTVFLFAQPLRLPRLFFGLPRQFKRGPLLLGLLLPVALLAGGSICLSRLTVCLSSCVNALPASILPNRLLPRLLFQSAFVSLSILLFLVQLPGKLRARPSRTSPMIGSPLVVVASSTMFRSPHGGRTRTTGRSPTRAGAAPHQREYPD
jgi:hypothetical protein